MNEQGKPAIEWLKELPEEYVNPALDYCEDEKTKREPQTIVSSLVAALDISFWWHLTKEGSKVWDNIYSLAEQGEFDNPPEPQPPTPRQQAESILREFAEWANSFEQNTIADKDVKDFLNTKYGNE